MQDIGRPSNRFSDGGHRTKAFLSAVAPFLLLPCVLDYKPRGAQDWSVVLYSLVVLVSFLSSLMLFFRFRPPLKGAGLWASGGALFFLLIFYASGVMRGQDQGDILKIAPSIFLFFVGIFSAFSISYSGISPQFFWNKVVLSAFFGLIVNLILVSTIDGINFNIIRYQILTGAVPLVGAHVVVLLIFGGFRPWSAAMAFLYVALVLLSVTRTQLVVVAAVVGFLSVFGGVKLLRAKHLPLQVASILVLALVGLLLGVFLPGAPLERWAERLTVAQAHNGYDITAVTRIGESKYQISQLRSSVLGFLFGFGAAPSYYDDANARIIALLLGQKSAYVRAVGIGHNNYVGSIYISGIIGGGVALFIQFFTLVRGISVVRALVSTENSKDLSLLSAPLGVVAFMAYGTLGGTMGSRSACITFGLAIGFTLWIFRVARDSRRVTSRSRYSYRSG